ncbi:MAG: hypothetical protein COZ47_04485 [Lysobacterales bacterium CG_4_10_14_3_um_filter_64_11]|nr:MAG: hypothetical protein COZ47_04485 [Xanthomonadales bacterium CG_4_10_14_3_um_filter_64_11]
MHSSPSSASGNSRCPCKTPSTRFIDWRTVYRLRMRAALTHNSPMSTLLATGNRAKPAAHPDCCNWRPPGGSSKVPLMTVLRRKLLCAATVLLTACASLPPPTAALADAEARIAMAREQRAARYAPADLDAAEAALLAAREAMDRKDFALAQQQASAALVQGDLALARAGEAALRAQVRGKTEENRQLRRQLGLRGGQ